MMNSQEAFEKLRQDFPSLFECQAQLLVDLAKEEADLCAALERLNAMEASAEVQRSKLREFRVRTEPIRLEIESINKKIADYLSYFPPAPIVVSSDEAANLTSSSVREAHG